MVGGVKVVVVVEVVGYFVVLYIVIGFIVFGGCIIIVGLLLLDVWISLLLLDFVIEGWLLIGSYLGLVVFSYDIFCFVLLW